MLGELPIPQLAEETLNSTELLRVWIAGDKFVCSFPVDDAMSEEERTEEATVWSQLLAEVSLHVADRLSGGEVHVIDPSILARIREHLELGTAVYGLEQHVGRIEGHHDLVRMFHAETDRAAAVLAGAYIDSFLEKVLRDFLVSDATVEDLFGRFGPLATFASRIELSFALGLVASNVRRDLNYIRKIRNHFAHETGAVSFDAAPVVDYCRQLTTAGKMVDQDDTMRQAAETPRAQYLLAIGMAVLRLSETILKQRRRTIPVSVPLSFTKVSKNA